ncbi:MAG: hypothetical protein AAF403_06590 [Pseudomonadota bacterium]
MTISSTARSVLLNLQNLDRLAERAQLRLSSGRNVNSATDDASLFFQAQRLRQTSSRYTDSILPSLRNATNTVTTANDATSAIISVLNQLRGLFTSTTSLPTAQRSGLTLQFNSVSRQILTLQASAIYNGQNLLADDSITAQIAPTTASTFNSITISGFALTSTIFGTGGQAAFNAANVANPGSVNFANLTGNAITAPAGGAAGFSVATAAQISTGLSRLDGAIANIQNQSSNLAANAAVINTILDYTTTYTSRLSDGANGLTQADVSEEGATLVALQTQQQLSLQSLSFQGRRQQAILAILS